MTKFIRVTEVMTDGDHKPLLLNIDCISHIQAGLDGHNTHIRMTSLNKFGNAYYYFVKESMEDINRMLT